MSFCNGYFYLQFLYLWYMKYNRYVWSLCYLWISLDLCVFVFLDGWGSLQFPELDTRALCVSISPGPHQISSAAVLKPGVVEPFCSFCTRPSKTLYIFFYSILVQFCYFFGAGVWMMKFVLQPLLNCTLSLSMPCQDSQSDLVLISFPQPISPGSFSVTAINIVFPGQQSFSAFLVSVSLKVPTHVRTSCCVCGPWIKMSLTPLVLTLRKRISF